MSTNPTPNTSTLSTTETGGIQGIQTRGMATRFKPGQTGNPKGRPRGPFSRATLREARKRGEDRSTQLDRVVRGLIAKAAGETVAKDGTKADIAKRADLNAVRLLHDILDGPIPSAEGEPRSGAPGPQVMVIVQDIAAGTETKV